jgi:hypothetical protein
MIRTLALAALLLAGCSLYTGGEAAPGAEADAGDGTACEAAVTTDRAESCWAVCGADPRVNPLSQRCPGTGDYASCEIACHRGIADQWWCPAS